MLFNTYLEFELLYIKLRKSSELIYINWPFKECHLTV